MTNNRAIIEKKKRKSLRRRQINKENAKNKNENKKKGLK